MHRFRFILVTFSFSTCFVFRFLFAFLFPLSSRFVPMVREAMSSTTARMLGCRVVMVLLWRWGGVMGCQSILFFVVLFRLILMKRVGGWEWTEHSGHIEPVYLTHPTTHPLHACMHTNVCEHMLNHMNAQKSASTHT